LPIALIVHGGAWNIPDDTIAAARDGVGHALESGFGDLKRGGSALDVVEAVIRRLEDDPTFDAGHGSRLNREGRVEMDAAIMDGTDLRAGAVAAIQDVRHPISVARQVMERSRHVMLVGAGARSFGERTGAELCTTEELLVGREQERFRRVRAGETQLIDDEFRPNADGKEMGTVGAVALDRDGRIAAATSTGGTQDKEPGRVGDTPVIGAGTYADVNAGGASASGWGEAILRVVLSKTAVDSLSAGLAPVRAAERAIRTLERIQGHAGLIVLDRKGQVGSFFNTKRMARGWATEAEGLRVELEPPDSTP